MINSTDFCLDFTVSSLNTICLAPEQIEQAAQLGNSISKPGERWQTYLNTLSLLGFESWLDQRAPEFRLNKSNFISRANIIYKLKIREFKLCLITQGVLSEQTITLPKKILELPSDVSHFYILITVDEEQEQISIEGMINYNQLRQYQQSGSLILQSDQTYEVPLAWLDADINHLLLYLRCLEPLGIQLPNLQEQSQPLIRSAINVGLWLKGQLDELAESLSWLLLPTPELATVSVSFRSLTTFYQILDKLREQGLFIPNNSGRAYLNFKIEETELQLYALTWLLEDSNEWSLLFILGTPNDQPLPEGLKLQIRDELSLLSEQEIHPNSNQTYLYIQVIGKSNEQFMVTITIRDRATITLPPFTFSIEDYL